MKKELLKLSMHMYTKQQTFKSVNVYSKELNLCSHSMTTMTPPWTTTIYTHLPNNDSALIAIKL